jgi:hypothetical protein
LTVLKPQRSFFIKKFHRVYSTTTNIYFKFFSFQFPYFWPFYLNFYSLNYPLQQRLSINFINIFLNIAVHNLIFKLFHWIILFITVIPMFFNLIHDLNFTNFILLSSIFIWSNLNQYFFFNSNGFNTISHYNYFYFLVIFKFLLLNIFIAQFITLKFIIP